MLEIVVYTGVLCLWLIGAISSVWFVAATIVLIAIFAYVDWERKQRFYRADLSDFLRFLLKKLEASGHRHTKIMDKHYDSLKDDDDTDDYSRMIAKSKAAKAMHLDKKIVSQ